jgi:hypothetical protein
MYATQLIIGFLCNFASLSFLILKNFHLPMQIPSTLVFYDNKVNVSDAAIYIDNLQPPVLCDTGLSQHYHNTMSIKHLDQVYCEFTGPDPSGIIHTTPSMQSVSLYCCWQLSFAFKLTNIYRALTLESLAVLSNMAYVLINVIISSVMDELHETSETRVCF